MKNGENYSKILAAGNIVQKTASTLKAERQWIQQVQDMRQAFINAPSYPPPVVGVKEPTATTIKIKEQGVGQMNTYGHPLRMQLEKNLKDVKNRLANAEAELQKEAQLLKNAEMRAKGGLVGNDGAKTLQYNIQQGLDAPFLPGNVGDINRVIWPFWFTSELVTLAPNQAANANITITQEAGFVWMSYTKAVFLEDPGNLGTYIYIDPGQPNASGKSNGLTFTIRDSQSARSFHNIPMNINQSGYWQKPSILVTPQLFLPNSNIEVTWQNNDANNTYRPFISMFGYRLRIDHAKDILGTVVG